ncbi:unnamed protein product [Mytilus edulis]|uniref:COR domain-containing protein n=1 Tax=Mytilus edulis TaxID=6550 RepID=A0A8S3SCN9_MYTED|nr:unnamed protein product [Mytilus edulis]
MPLNEEELRLFLEYHHEIRALVYFKDLPDFIILDTQWLSDAFKCIVTAEKFQFDVSRHKMKEKLEDLNVRGILHTEVLDDIFKDERNVLYKHEQHKDDILNIMEKFDIIIPATRESADEKPCYYVPCMVKSKPEYDIYKMLNVTKDTCQKSTWLCFKFRFLPPHLINHLIASLSRVYEVAQLTVHNKKKLQVALFKDNVVFELKQTKLRKLLLMKFQNIIQVQVLEFGTGAVIKREPEVVTGSNEFSEEEITEYLCGSCTKLHPFIGEWSKDGHEVLSLSKSPEDVPRYYPNAESLGQIQTTGTSTKVRVRVQAGERVFSNINDEATGTDSSSVLTKEEINFTKMGMIALNIFADVLYDLLKQDKANVCPRIDCDITYLYGEHRKLNIHIPSNSWGGKWQRIQTTDIAIGDDIERIRLMRNELQHSRIFKLDETRFNELSNMSSDILKRFDRHNTPLRLYTDHLNDILAKTISAEEVKSIENEISGSTRNHHLQTTDSNQILEINQKSPLSDNI